MPNASSLRDKQYNASEIASNTFPYLDLGFLWITDRELEYQVHRKPSQKLKFLNKGRTHKNAMINKIPSGIFYRLEKIIWRMKKNAQMKIDERYQGHTKTLSKAGLGIKIYRTLRDIWKKADASKLNNDKKREKRSGGWEHTTYFCIGISKIWREKIYNIIKKLRD